MSRGQVGEGPEAVARLLRPWSPILVSNRAPYEPRPGGGYRKGAGGLVTGLTTLAEASGADYVACARTDAERLLSAGAGDVDISEGHRRISVHYVDTDPARYHLYYSVISNPLLWFLQHYLWDLSREPLIDHRLHHAWREGYASVNRAVADRVIEVAGRVERTPLIMTQDYQLYLAPRVIRDRLPQAALQHFVHIPWPNPQYWKVLPAPIRDAIVDGLLANDIVGFQSRIDARQFLLTCQENMGLAVNERQMSVSHRGRRTWVRSYPISVDVQGLERQARSAGVAAEEARLREWRPERLIVRVDRTDPSKNIIRGFLSYERLLVNRPDLRRRLQFWAFLQASRQDVPAYRDHLRQIRRVVERINSELGDGGWLPIRLEVGESMRKALAAYRNFDVLLVNSIYDGMNLVAKEAVLLNRTNGVLVLSENAGAFEELGEDAVAINPFDIDATAEALEKALEMPAGERRRRGDRLRQVVRSRDIRRWIELQLQDLRELVPPTTPPAF